MKQIQITRTARKRDVPAPDLRTPSGRALPF
jgi:hypothetical protein